MLQALIWTLCLATLCLAEYASYDGYQVLHVNFKAERDISVIRNLANDVELDVWHYPEDWMVPPGRVTHVTDMLEKNGIEYEVKIRNVQSILDNQLRSEARNTLDLEYFDFTRYYNLSEINVWMDEIAAAYPTLVSQFVVGYSYENRPMNALKFSSPEGAVPKHGIWYHGGIHSREWISPATVMWMTNQFLEDYESDPEIKAMLDDFDFYVLPVLNVDGYEHTWTDNRMWRKTRSPNEGSTCIGTDPNRNYDFMWGCKLASDNPCASDYRGASAASEVEIKAVQDYLMQATTEQTFAMSIDFHSYSQWWVTPWAYTNETAPHYVDLDASAAAAVTALESVHGTQYQSGALINGGSGLAMDWYYAEALIKYSYLVELRDTGEYGFLLPEDQIIPSGEETYAGMKAAITYILNHEF
ncbi:carboxypeptidase B-like [Saccoglossus kowalevskii]